MEIKNKLTITRGEGGGGLWEREGEGSSEETCAKDPRTTTMGWRFSLGGGVGWGRGKQQGYKLRQL